MLRTVFRRQSLIAQIAEHVRQGAREGRWGRYVPGVRTLATELGVSKDTVRAALRILEKENSVTSEGAGNRRRITGGPPERRRGLRVAILLDEHLHANNAHSLELILVVRNAIETMGHSCLLCDKSLKQMPQVRLVGRFVEETNADAWIVYSAPRDVLEWFSGCGLPALAIGGRCLGLSLASVSTDVKRAMAATVDALVALHHTRIVLVCPSLWRDPSPGPSARALLERLDWHGLSASDYNLPTWQETPDGLQEMLKSVFRTTPPTALVITEPSVSVGVRIFLAERGLAVPRDVSVVSLLPDPVFSFHRPVIAHFEWPTSRVVDRVMAWIDAVSQGSRDRSATVLHARFCRGGTIATANKRNVLGTKHP